MIAAQSIILAVQRAMNDEPGDRVPASVLVPLLNRAQREIATVRPDTTASLFTHTLTAGANQTLPSTASALIDIPSNTSGGQRITKVGMPLLDASEPKWRAKTPATVIHHFMYDLRTPRVFRVYPPAVAGAQVEMEATLYPTEIAAPVSPGKLASTVSGNVSIRDEWESALFCLTTYYAYLTDLEGVNNPGLAAGYLQRASSILGAQLQGVVAVEPKN